MNITITLNLLGMRLFEIRQDSMRLNVDGDATLETVVSLADAINPGLRGAIVDGAGRLSKRVAVLINGDNAEFRGGLRARLQPDDVINVIPALAGGI